MRVSPMVKYGCQHAEIMSPACFVLYLFMPHLTCNQLCHLGIGAQAAGAQTDA